MYVIRWSGLTEADIANVVTSISSMAMTNMVNATNIGAYVVFVFRTMLSLLCI